MRAVEFIIEYKEYPTKEYEGVTFTMKEKDGQLIVKPLNDYGISMGHVVFNMDGKILDPQDLVIADKYQGQGIAKVMYDYIKSQGFTIERSWDQTPAGKGFWDKHRGEDARVWEEQIKEAREGAMREIIRKALPGWPDYVIKDWISSRIKNEKDLKDLTGWMGELNKMVQPNSWKLHQKMFLTFDMLSPQTRYFMKTKRQFGARNPFLIPRDEERSANAEQLIKTQGMENLPPVIMLQHANGLALQEGWHRTMAAFRLYPNGFYINAWIGQST